MAGNDLAAAILVGGQSRRMGENKALLPIRPDGETVLESVIRTLCRITGEIALVGVDAAPYAHVGVPWIADRTPGIGPLGGIHTALVEMGAPHTLVVACDMPFLSEDLLRYMVSCPRDYDVLLPGVDAPQPLHAIYARACIPFIEANIQAGIYKVTGWFAQARVRVIDREIVQRYDPALRSWFNMNTPEEYAFARSICANVS